jgi:hypothetical protein
VAAIHTSRSTKVRVLLGVVSVPPALAVLGFFVFGVFEAAGLLPYGGRLSDSGSAGVGVGLVIGVLAFLVTVGGALPLVLQMAERGPLDRKRLLVAGALLGNVPLVLIIVGATLVNLAAGTLERGRELYEIGPNLLRALIGAVTGLTGASIFWFVGVRDTELDPDHVDMPAGADRSLIPRG